MDPQKMKITNRIANRTSGAGWSHLLFYFRTTNITANYLFSITALWGAQSPLDYHQIVTNNLGRWWEWFGPETPDYPGPRA
jgi:hypothetical protein